MRVVFRSLIGLTVLLGSFWGTLTLLDHNFFSEPKLIVERTYDYRAGKSGKKWLGAGWTWPESFGVWTDGERSELSVALDHRTRRVEMTMDTSAYIVAKRPWQEVAVILNGREVAKWQYDRQTTRAVREIEASSAEFRDGTISIALAARDPVSPQAIGESVTDARRIALGLIALTVREFD